MFESVNSLFMLESGETISDIYTKHNLRDVETSKKKNEIPLQPQIKSV